MEDINIIKRLAKEDKLTITNVYDEIKATNSPTCRLTQVVIREHICDHGGYVKKCDKDYIIGGNSPEFKININTYDIKNIFIEGDKIYKMTFGGLDCVYGIEIDIITRPCEDVLDFIKKLINVSR